jgi:hypothetical protein
MMSKPSTSAQLDQQTGLIAIDGSHDQPLVGGTGGKTRTHHDVGLLAHHDHVAAGLDCQHRVAHGSLGMAGRLHHHLDRQVQHHRQVTRRNVVPRLPGLARLRSGSTDAHAACFDADIPQDAGRRIRIHVDGDPGAHARHVPGLREVAAPEAARADHAGLDLAVPACKKLMVVQAAVPPWWRLLAVAIFQTISKHRGSAKPQKMAEHAAHCSIYGTGVDELV